ncbi:hypothetical protein [Kitasatospora sp. NPDC050463]|uniref:hypothetical protein n=1 Tax=Kitasatospora sp. NPDC050463 TaxID=3155786 RepID=UPI0033EC9431
MATRLAVHRPQQIHGHGPESTLAVLTFTDDSIERVVPAFEELVRRIVPAEAIASHPPKVLGARENPGTSRLFPRALGCYVPKWHPSLSPTGASRLLYAYRAATAMVLKDQRLGPAANFLWEAVRGLAWQMQAPTRPLDLIDGLPTFSQLDRRTGTTGHGVRTLLATTLHSRHDTPAAWEDFVHRLTGLLGELTGAPIQLDPTLHEAWLSYSSPPESNETSLASPSTTARAKGETHCATLVLECATKNGKSHDLGGILPVITGSMSATQLNATSQHAAMTTFVAATRARHALVLAIHRDRAEAHRPALTRDGWLVLEV